MKSLFVFFRTLALTAYLVFSSSARAAVTVINYWRMGEADPGGAPGASPVTAVDSVGGDNLTYSGSAQYSSDVPTSSKFVSTLSVDFLNGGTNVSYALGTIPTTVVDNFGVEAWVKLTGNNSSGSSAVIVYGGNSGTTGWGLFYDPDTHGYAGLFGGVDIPGDQRDSATNDVWEDVAMVRQNGLATLYINGFPQPYKTSSGPVPPNGIFAIGTTPAAAGTQNFNGLVDEVRIFTFTPGQFDPTVDLWVSAPLPPAGTITNLFALGTTNLIESGAAGTDSVQLSDTLANNAWTATANSSWLHLSATNQSGIGNALLVFSFDANPGGARTGSLNIAGQNVSVTQAPASYSPAQLVNAILPTLPDPSPAGIALDSSGNIYFSDTDTNAIWEWNASNQVATILPIQGLAVPQLLALDRSNNLFITEQTNVEEWSPDTQTLTTIITNLQNPGGLAVDTNGNVYVSDLNEALVEKWSAGSHIITTVTTNIDYTGSLCLDSAGNLYVMDGAEGVLDELKASDQTLHTFTIPSLTFGSYVEFISTDGVGNIYILDHDYNVNQDDVVEWNPISQIATELFVDGSQNTSSMTADQAGNVYVGLDGPYAIRKWTAANQTLSPLIAAAPANPFGYALDSSNNLYIADPNDRAIYKWTAATGSYSPFITTNLGYPFAVALDATGNIYVADPGSNAVFKFNPSGVPIATLMSNLNYPGGVAVDASGNVYASEIYNDDILEWIAASNSVILYGPSFSFLNNPQGVALDVTGKLYIADQNDNRIVVWDPVGQILTPILNLNSPVAVAVDGSGNVYSQDGSTGQFVRWQPKENTIVNLSPGQLLGAGIAVDAAGDLFTKSPAFSSQVAEIPHAFLNANALTESYAAGSASLPLVIPSTFNPASLQPSSSQPWLTITGVTNGVVSFAFAANTTGASRTGYITLLGQSIQVTQPANPPTLINPVMVSNGVFSFGITNMNTNATFTVLTSTNLALPLTNWTILGTTAAGSAQFTDTTATNSPRFYIVH